MKNGFMENGFLAEQLVKEFIPGSTLAVIYETYSSAWELPLVIVKELVESGWVVPITNYMRPLGHLIRDLNNVGLDAEKSLEHDQLFIIDVFGSRYGLKEDRKNVFYLDSVDPETLNPKIFRIIYEKILPKAKAHGKKVLRLIYPLHGVVQIAGEEATIKMLGHHLTQHATLPVESSMIISLNKDTVSKNFTSWVVELSDYVLLSKVFIERNMIEEHLYFLKAPLREFRPGEYLLIKTGRIGKERFGMRRIGGFSP